MAHSAEQIAKNLNLSITTVRLVLNGKADKYRISPKTQERIHKYVEVHGYSVNRIAQSLKINKTHQFALVIPRLTNFFFSNLAEQLESRCHQSGYQLMICCTYNNTEHEKKLIKSLEEHSVDGIFIVSATEDCQRHAIKYCSKPIVFLDRNFAIDNASYVVSNNYQSSYYLTTTMRSMISEPIYFFAGDRLLPTIKERLQGYSDAIQDYQTDIYIHYSAHNTVMDGKLMMEKYIAHHKNYPHNFIASSLPILDGLLSVVHQYYGKIPQDINIGTFDESLSLDFLPNNVWSIKQNDSQLALNAFQLMLDKIQNNDIQKTIIVESHLVKRTTKL
ncbi:LacI family transcriptional regulator [Conservatibacter flavescens]|uniref:LacI family transcriptional regulator n=2 Tax=Conservatibacter flavescens TaxID=28161 RepID=A0A2M8RZJ4_9PAST|nr:LacI family transcriptional regulator [Conservatibacter flavescens]